MNLEQAKQRRFKVLDDVREIKSSKNNMSATISVGLGKDASDTAESERWARQALDMALGLYGISRSIHIGSGPSLTEAQDCELRDIEARLERLMGVHRWPCRWQRPCSS